MLFLYCRVKIDAKLNIVGLRRYIIHHNSVLKSRRCVDGNEVVYGKHLGYKNEKNKYVLEYSNSTLRNYPNSSNKVYT